MSSAIIRKNNQKHGYHLVDPSPWPILGACGALMATFGGVLYMNGYLGGKGRSFCCVLV